MSYDSPMPPENPYAQGMPAMAGGTPPKPPRPSSVSTAVKLMYAGAVVTVLSVLLTLTLGREDMRSSTEESLRNSGQSVTPEVVDSAVLVGVVFAIVFSLVVVAIWVLMAVFNGKGHNWARITATVLAGINVLFTLASLLGSSMMGGGGSTLSMIFSIISLVLAIVIVVLLWKRESSAFFSPQTQPTAY